MAGQDAVFVEGTTRKTGSGHNREQFVLTFNTFLFGGSLDAIVGTVPYPAELISISEIHRVAESGGTVGIMPERCQGTEAVGSGDDLLSAAFDGVATALTLQEGALLTTAVVHFAKGDRLVLDFTGDTPGELAGVSVTALFARD